MQTQKLKLHSSLNKSKIVLIPQNKLRHVQLGLMLLLRGTKAGMGTIIFKVTFLGLNVLLQHSSRAEVQNLKLLVYQTVSFFYFAIISETGSNYKVKIKCRRNAVSQNVLESAKSHTHSPIQSNIKSFKQTSLNWSSPSSVS